MARILARCLSHAAGLAGLTRLRGQAPTEVVVTRLDQPQAAVRTLAALLSGGERQRASRFMLDREPPPLMVARARLRQLLGARLGVRPADDRTDAGRSAANPRSLPAAATRCGFNTSRCGDLAVFAFSRRQRSRHRRRSHSSDAARRRHRRALLRAPGTRGVSGAGARDRPLGFLNGWTRKEAFIKALGDGLSYPLDRFAVSLVPGAPARILYVADPTAAARGWQLESFTPAPGFVAAVVAA